MAHTHDASKKRLMRRLKIIEGQIRGLQNMIKKDIYCVDVITQTSAVKQGLSNVENMILENHLSTCVVKQIQGGNSKKAVDEVLKVYKLKRK
ncbi:MAG: metal-sensitive transcriptional regulator [bacterium]|nr:metal-sensitive transcriptional regulator [bacterium]